METTYGMACATCWWMVDNLPTTEHVERAYLAHVRTRHPEDLARTSAAAVAGECRPLFFFNSILTPTGYQSTCRACGDVVTTTDARVIDDWPAVHILDCRALAVDLPWHSRRTARRKEW